MKVDGMPMILLLLLLCAAKVSAGVGGKATSHRHPHSTISLGELDGGNHDEAEMNITQVEPTRISRPHAMMAFTYQYGRSMMEAVVVARPHVDFGSILQQGDVAEILMALCHPSRLIRSILLSWAATEAWRQSGLFQRRRRPKKQRQGKRYRRFTSTRKTYKTKVKGIIEEPLDEEQFKQEYASSRRGQRAQARKSSDILSNIVPESQEKGNSLTKTQKESLLKEYEVERPRSRHKTKTGKKRFGFEFGFLRLTRKKKFSVAWSLGHILSPCLMTPIGGAIAGWVGVLCVSAELIPWIDKKCKVDVLEDNEFLEWLLEPFRDNDILKAFLFGSFVGACYSNM